MSHQEITRNNCQEKPNEGIAGGKDSDFISKDQVKPLVSVIVVNWNGLKHIDECLKSLLDQIYSPIEIILVDNCSEDGSVEFVRQNFSSVKIIMNGGNMGFAAAMNRGIISASGELIASLNQNTVADKNWLSKLVEVILSSEDIAGASGKIYYLDNKDSIYCTWVKINPFTAIPYSFHGLEGTSSVDYLIGCAMVIRRDAIDKIGLIDEGYFLYYEDSDWCARLIRAGYRLLYVPDAIAWHAVSGSVSSSCFKFSYVMRNRIRFILKNFDVRYIFLFIMLFPIEILIDLKNDIARKDLRASRIRFNAVLWNILNMRSTYNARRRDLSRIVHIKSYNRSLPLRSYKIGFFEKWT